MEPVEDFKSRFGAVSRRPPSRSGRNPNRSRKEAGQKIPYHPRAKWAQKASPISHQACMAPPAKRLV